MAEERWGGLCRALLVLSALLSPGAYAQIKRPEGGEVTMEAKYTGDPTEINWKLDGNKVVDMELEPLNIHFYRLHGRANISESNGSLTIRNLTVGDSGHYMAEALVDNMIQETPYDLTVIACPTKPTISNITTENQIELSCRSKTSGVAYEWWNQTRLVAQKASYTANRTREGGTLTCVVYVDKDMCENNSSITIPPIPGPGRSRVGLIPAFFVFGALIIAPFVYFCCIQNRKPQSQPEGKQDEEKASIPPENRKSESQPAGTPDEEKAWLMSENGEDEENPSIPPGSKQPDAEQGGHQEAEQAAEEALTAEQNTPESPRSGPQEEQAEKQDITVPRNTPESPQSGSKPEEEGVADKVVQKVAVQVAQPAAEQALTAARITPGSKQPDAEQGGHQGAEQNTPESPRSGSQEEQAEKLNITVPRNTPESPRSGSQPEKEGVADKVVQKVAVQVAEPAAEQALTAARITPVSKMGCLTLIPSFLGEVQHYTFQKIGNPLIKATLGKLVDGQMRRIESLRLTVEEVKTEDNDEYTAEAHLSNGKTCAIPKKDSDCNTITFDLPDTKDVTKVALKGGDVQWWWELCRLQAEKLTLEPSSVIINHLEPEDSGTYKIDVHCAENCIVSNTFKLEVVKQKREHRLKLVKEVTPENGHPANEPIANITLHPTELTEEAQVTWMKNGQQLDIEDGRIQHHTNGDLTIDHVTSADKGTYSVHYNDPKLKQEFHLAF